VYTFTAFLSGVINRVDVVRGSIPRGPTFKTHKQNTMDTQLATINNGADITAIEKFTKVINEKPPSSSLQKTPDGKADTMGISFVETKLDEIYLRQWGTEEVNVMQLGNEVLVWLTLWVIDPQTKTKITQV